jgi:hypothetical protein
MKRRRGAKTKTTWEDFEQRVGLKRTRGEKDGKRSTGTVPSDILVQRMSSTASGRLKKYEPLDTRDFVPFSDYDELSIENIKDACEQFYNAPQGTCDILASDRGPSCTKIEQIKGKKVYFIRFLQPTDSSHANVGTCVKVGHQAKSAPAVSPSKSTHSHEGTVRTTPTVYPKSLSISDLMKAGKLVKPPKTAVLRLEFFDVQKCYWSTSSASMTLEIDEKPFASGGFRDAFVAKCNDDSSNFKGDWVVKKYQEQSIKTIEDTLKMSVEAHTRKQVQMHNVARNITQRFSAKIPAEFGQAFSYGKVFYSILENVPVTVEAYIPGEFVKYINNDGECMTCPNEGLDELFLKAQCLSHFSYEYSNNELMILDIQGSGYSLYDPEISTTRLDGGSKSSTVYDETYFCAGNLSFIGINEFKKQHRCNKFCEMMGLIELNE